ncbi:dihydropteroate synthase [Halostagnicola sp. A-GB9-2]|uniref:dihydropteroate synthase n=1 Tax=Halostagnicola sp. A-GB9-2 TaxID=3048066 RepID=UPI0024C0A969|nr:dihydropteroate synthase [Halostagnicola sp. A-GB9-2]MDJ1434351.1 dihydropteroate synthase [Halostagnicola sp. A-GB9-2]
MEYFEAVNYLATLQRSRPKFGTETTENMLRDLEVPYDTIDYIQIAGSNGKGSTASMLASVLEREGVDVGLYTSPDLNDLRERICLNGRKIPKSRLTSLVSRIQSHVNERAAAGDAPTQFEVLTALAFAYFTEQDVDIAILEVGIGGRYDATSVVDPVASAVTSVSLEHTDLLGETVEEIARDKAQVAPSDGPLVTGAIGEALSAIREETATVTVGGRGSDVRVESHGVVSETEERVTVQTPEWDLEARIPLLGTHQAINAGIATVLATQVADVERSTVEEGLRRVQWPGRFEIVTSEPYVALDGAHNPDACSKLASLVDRYDYDRLHVVLGVLQDKDHEEMVATLPRFDTAVVCQPDVDRAESPETLESIVDRETAADVTTAPTVLTAVERAIDRAEPDDFVLVTGSLYTVAEARDRWTRRLIPKRTRSRASLRKVLENSQISPTRASSVLEDFQQQTVKTFCRPRSVDELTERMRSVGGAATASAIEGVHQHVDVVLNGSHNQFRQLIEALEETDGELSHIASQLRTTLGFDEDNPWSEYPWAKNSPAIMGVANVTPDSFHDGGEYNRTEDAVERATRLIEDGADIVDIGGESTRPGAKPVPADQEIDRVIPVVERLADRSSLVAVDTQKAEVAKAALDAGADIINDVSGLVDPEMRQVVAENDVPVVVMHSLETPVNPDQTVPYDDIVEDVIDDLTERILLAERNGIERERIIVDPGIGFGKNASESFELIGRLDELQALGCPVLLGHSHKSLFSEVGCGPDDRLAPTVAATALAAERRADIIRVHDVAENAAAVRTARSVKQSGDNL